MKGAELTREIEKELIRMIDEGYQNSPISQASLAKRLIYKKVISGKSTLTSRKDLIEQYAQKQIDALSGEFKKSAKQGSNQSRADLIRANAALRKEKAEAQKQVEQNTVVLINIIKYIRLKTKAQNIERVLSPHLIRELGKEM
ncbi:hypothetical protein [Vibrio nereis]|uniref:hypothetical protein n=1 Tax=Vibrio nereis TaxID=693 RepID=UPI0024942095|nr:hypothetical protein [Vibrio nereis]